ncbi:hypothetical protein ABFA07_003810 [Porites harrisoni]
MALDGIFFWRTGFFFLCFTHGFSSSSASGREADGSDDDFHKRNLLQLGVSQSSSCSGMSQTLSEGCSIGDDCSTITCDMNFVETPITFKLKVNKCDDPVSVTALLDVHG